MGTGGSSKKSFEDMGEFANRPNKSEYGWLVVKKPSVVRGGLPRNSSKVAKLSVGTEVYVTDMKQSRALISKPVRGWISGRDLTRCTGWGCAKFTTPIFAEQSVHAEQISTLKKGYKCYVMEMKQGWCRILRPKTGWVLQRTDAGQQMLEQIDIEPGWHSVQFTMLKIHAKAKEDSAVVARVGRDDKLKIDEIDRTFGRVTVPAEGWISLYRDYGDIVVEPMNPHTGSNMIGRWHKVLHNCIMRQTQDKTSDVVGTVPADGRVVYVEDIFMDRAKLTKIAYMDENENKQVALALGWVPIITSNGDLILQEVENPETELEKQFLSPSMPDQPVQKSASQQFAEFAALSNLEEQKVNEYEAEQEFIAFSNATPQGPDILGEDDEKQSEAPSRQSEAPSILQFPPDGYLIPHENPYGPTSVTHAVQTAKHDAVRRMSRQSDYAVPNHERNNVTRGDQVLFNGRRGQVVDVANDSGDQMLTIRFPDEAATKIVSRKDVILDASPEPAGHFSINQIQAVASEQEADWFDMVEELGAILNADVIKDRELFLEEWRLVYGVDPSMSETSLMLGRSVEITALDLKHNTARSIVNNQVIWIPRPVLIEKSIPQFILDEDRIEGDDEFAEAEEYAAVPIDNQEHQQSEGDKPTRRGSDTTKVPVTRMVHQITGRAKAVISAQKGNIHPSRLAYSNLTDERLMEIAGRPAVPVAYDSRHDAYLIEVDGESVWVPSECAVILPDDVEMEDTATKQIEFVDIDPNLEGYQPTSPIPREQAAETDVAEETPYQESQPVENKEPVENKPEGRSVVEIGVLRNSEGKYSRKISEGDTPGNDEETPGNVVSAVVENAVSGAANVAGDAASVAKNGIGAAVVGAVAASGASAAVVVAAAVAANKSNRKMSSASEGARPRNMSEGRARAPPSPLSKKPAIAEFSVRIHPAPAKHAQPEGEKVKSPNVKKLAKPVKCVVTMNKSEIKRSRANAGLPPLDNQQLAAVQGKKLETTTYDPDSNCYLVESPNGDLWIPNDAMMVIGELKFNEVEENAEHQRGGEKTPPRIDGEGEPANVAVRKNDPALDMRKVSFEDTSKARKGRKLDPHVRGVVTMSRKLLETTWDKAGGTRHDLLDTLKGQRVDVTEIEQSSQLCKCIFRRETLWLPSGALMFLDKQEFADGGVASNPEEFSSKPKETNPYANPIPASPPTPVKIAPDVKHTSSNTPGKRPKRFDGRELQTPLNCVVTMNREKLKTHLSKEDSANIERLKGTSVNATSVHTDANGTWYRILANGKNMWVPQDILLVKGSPDYRPLEPRPKSPGSNRAVGSLEDAYSSRIAQSKAAQAASISPRRRSSAGNPMSSSRRASVEPAPIVTLPSSNPFYPSYTHTHTHTLVIRVIRSNRSTNHINRGTRR